MKIFTENRININFKNFGKSTYPELDETVLYLVHTDSYSSSEISSFQKLLSLQEQEKASRFRFLKDQHSYIVTHAMLRKILGNYLNSEPAKIEFVSNDFGKPSLAEKHSKIDFNLSHRSGLSVLAFSPKSEIGVDVEKIDAEFDFNRIAKAHFSVAENIFIHEIQEETRERFYTVWTRKEALLKAIGTGIGENLEIEVFRKFNHSAIELPIQGVQDKDYYLDSFIFQNDYMVTIAGSYHGRIIGLYLNNSDLTEQNSVRLNSFCNINANLPAR
jgi:4'-phosphopantetheinyl transferase